MLEASFLHRHHVREVWLDALLLELRVRRSYEGIAFIFAQLHWAPLLLAIVRGVPFLYFAQSAFIFKHSYGVKPFSLFGIEYKSVPPPDWCVR